MANFLAPIINDQQEDVNGNPLSGGTISVYLAGTSTPAATYTDAGGLTANAWPIVLNTLGLNTQGQVWLTGGSAYKFIIKDANGITQRTEDNISGVNDNSVAVDQWSLYPAAPTYISATSFSVTGDQTQIFQVGRRLKTQNTGGLVYSTITGVSYSAPNTTVTVASATGALDAGLSQVSYGLISAGENTSLPGGIEAFGQCRLVKSGANLVLQPYKGNKLTINNAICTIPAAGVSLAPSGAVALTLYYIYAYLSATGIALEYSTTGHSTDANTGVEIKTGDATRTLVGMARAIAGPQWADTATNRFVASWFNRRKVRATYTSNAPFGYGGATFTNISVFQPLEFLSWGDESVPVKMLCQISHTTVNSIVQTGMAIDQFNTPNVDTSDAWQAYASPANGTAHFYGEPMPAEGYHFFAPCGATTAADATWATAGTFSATVVV